MRHSVHGVPEARKLLRTGIKGYLGGKTWATHRDKDTARKFIELATKTGGLIPGSKAEMERIFGRDCVFQGTGVTDLWTFSGWRVFPYSFTACGPVWEDTE